MEASPVYNTRMRAYIACFLAFLPFTAAWGQPRVIVITPHVDAIRNEFGRGFAEWHAKHFNGPAVVEWRNVGGTADSVRFIQSEFSKKPEGIGIDCLFGGGMEPYLLLDDKKLLQAYRPPAEIVDSIPQSVLGMDAYDPEFTWFGAAFSSFGILQNKRVQGVLGLPLAHAWQDLTNPALMGWIGAGDPRNSGTMNVMFEAFLQYFGWEEGWRVLTQIAGNTRKFDRVSSSTAKDVTLGETALRLISTGSLRLLPPGAPISHLSCRMILQR
jgi:ABC-type Fe3+ transport system substrate-binding protein